ncbi:MAG: carbohydrate kinase family protein [Hydrogenophaga sp.]|uniref:carbohydrate kinase family protein n=1 Tax=Hydrogenophaga sp. TaxID=1904254 RepID=UPI0016AFC343|nr:carbohydrate kinase family protein [Hydrogenophaga sp.]NIM42478.1 carbohydrate kinase family protein [Hydrogenophaga sp.]NIN27629.1 carbohydrate kinase family protein [Hydrogenophaga sp.]NIN32449.1 carbohydrate kinase family protein [Hydrogenophaga sp.]NIN56900.1 carbohydrate kinase family protein [Hydrogenophaga sp.]NIO53045.1 carbohydrate kinase family protein [Hydrogenophaga sp.]
MPILVCGSLAFDTIMTFEGRFADQILPDQLHILNVSFLVPGLRRDFGGCAGNIAYGLRQLGAEVAPLAALGSDGADYLARMRELGVDTAHVSTVADAYTAQAMIMTDRDNNQITAFHPGAMSFAHDTPVPARKDLTLGIIAPDGREGMVSHAAQLKAAGVPFVFDPGQGLPMFNGEELLRFIDQASWVAVNDYEGRMLCDRTGLSLADISQRVRGLVVTLADQGCDVWENGVATRVPGVKAEAVVDPTGCGDAFRAALLHGLSKGWPLTRCAELGNRLGALKIAVRGPQNYTVDPTLRA